MSLNKCDLEITRLWLHNIDDYLWQFNNFGEFMRVVISNSKLKGTTQGWLEIWHRSFAARSISKWMDMRAWIVEHYLIRVATYTLTDTYYYGGEV